MWRSSRQNEGMFDLSDLVSLDAETEAGVSMVHHSWELSHKTPDLSPCPTQPAGFPPAHPGASCDTFILPHWQHALRVHFLTRMGAP